MSRSCDFAHHRFDGAGKLVDQFTDLLVGDYERRRQQDMVAVDAIDRAAHRIADQASVERGLLEPGMDAQLGIERCLGLAIGDQLDALEQPTPANVADMRMLAEALDQCGVQFLSLLARPPDEPAPDQCVAHREPGRTSDGVADVGVAMLEEAGALRSWPSRS